MGAILGRRSTAFTGPAAGWRGGSARSFGLGGAAGAMSLRGGTGMAGEGVDLTGLRAGIMEAAVAGNEFVQIDAAGATEGRGAGVWVRERHGGRE